MRVCLVCLWMLLAACGDDASAMDSGPSMDGGVFDGTFPDAGPPLDGALEDGAPEDAGPPPIPPPDEIFFVGNSFTLGGPVPTLVQDLAVSAGFPVPAVDYRAVGGQSLRFHREDMGADNAPNRVGEGWDVVVLQDLSTRPTDAGDAPGFKEDALWFHDLALNAQADCRVVLYETWARRSNHPIYPGRFDDPFDMQAQLRFHYFDAADNYIPMMSELTANVVVAPVGDAWETQLLGGEPPRLHGADDYHAGAAGQYLNALVLYATIYETTTQGLDPIGVDATTAAALQDTADATTGFVRSPPGLGARSFPVGQSLWLDIGPTGAGAAEWTTIDNGATVAGLRTIEGDSTSARVSTVGFSGTQVGGVGANELGWPAEVSSDTLWIGSFDGHDAALGRDGIVRLAGLPEGIYEVRVFASRTGDDAGRGRLTRYRLGGEAADLEAADNTSEQVVFTTAASGSMELAVTVSPAGTARFAYVGAVEVRRLD